MYKIVFALIVFVSCHSSTLVSRKTHYDLIDTGGNLHRYGDDVYNFEYPRDSKQLTQYCIIDHQWEDIKAVYRKADGVYQYKYRVYANKKN